MRLRRRELLLVLCALLVVATAGVVRLASRSDAASPPAGIAERSFTARGRAGDVRVTAIGVSLTDRRYEERPMLTRGKRLSDLGAAAAIDGDFYNLTTERPSGRLVIDGAVLAGSAAEPGISLNGGATAIERYPRSSAAEVISGKPRLIVGGRRVSDFAIDGATHQQDTAAVPRSAVAIEGNELWLVACGEPGLTMTEWARALAAQGYRDALNLDGGPSTGLVVEHRVLAGQDARVPTALAIVRAG